MSKVGKPGSPLPSGLWPPPKSAPPAPTGVQGVLLCWMREPGLLVKVDT